VALVVLDPVIQKVLDLVRIQLVLMRPVRIRPVLVLVQFERLLPNIAAMALQPLA
jgi:hypothetical protein